MTRLTAVMRSAMAPAFAGNAFFMMSVEKYRTVGAC